MKSFVLGLAALTLLVSTLAFGPLSLASEELPTFVVCLNHDDNVCNLVSPSVGLSVSVEGNQPVISYFAPLENGYIERARTTVGPDLEARVREGRMSEQEANLIFSEIAMSPYVEYRLPSSSEELNMAVGFQSDVKLSPVDQIEILRAH